MKIVGNKKWKLEEKKFLKAIEAVRIPNAQLDDVDCLQLKSKADLNKIPNGGGCYWIWTSEPVYHHLHKNQTPEPIGHGEIIYNGIAKDDVRGRIEKHLFAKTNQTWSGISVDIFNGRAQSHHKKACSPKGKVPFIKTYKKAKRDSKNKNLKKGDEIIKFESIRSVEQLCKINLSQYEKRVIKSMKLKEIYFRNGIDITKPKHKKHNFFIYFITGLSSMYLDFVEKKWRINNGLPKLCSYSTGR